MKKILALDTSTARVSVALLHGTDVVRELHAGELMGAQFHSELLASLVKECLVGERPEVIAVGRGPGPYTGLRVGIVTADVLAAAWQLEIIGVSTLEALAHGYRRRGGGDCVAVLDVKRREIAWQAFNAEGEALTGPAIVAIADLSELPDLPIVGPAFVTQTLVTPAVIDASPVSAVDIALLARELLGTGQPTSATPLYLRDPDAVAPAPRKPVTNG